MIDAVFKAAGPGPGCRFVVTQHEGNYSATVTSPYNGAVLAKIEAVSAEQVLAFLAEHQDW